MTYKKHGVGRREFPTVGGAAVAAGAVRAVYA